jgi:hypothetical protein
MRGLKNRINVPINTKNNNKGRKKQRKHNGNDLNGFKVKLRNYERNNKKLLRNWKGKRKNKREQLYEMKTK